MGVSIYKLVSVEEYGEVSGCRTIIIFSIGGNSSMSTLIRGFGTLVRGDNALRDISR